MQLPAFLPSSPPLVTVGSAPSSFKINSLSSSLLSTSILVSRDVVRRINPSAHTKRVKKGPEAVGFSSGFSGLRGGISELYGGRVKGPALLFRTSDTLTSSGNVYGEVGLDAYTDAWGSKQALDGTKATSETLEMWEAIADAERCNLWKEEVSTGVVVAGLFSAVVTAFLIESQKALRKDPGQALLEYLVASKINETAAPFSLNTFPPPEGSDIRVNTLWFLSLILSITAVLVGTTALQWVREHQRDQRGLDPQIAFSLHRMQRLDHTIFQWVGTIIALPLLFMVLTTILPTLQAILLFVPFNVVSPRIPCPYKSPQAWAFHQLLSPVVKAFIRAFGKPWDVYSRIDAQDLVSDRTRDYWVDTLPHGTGILFRNNRGDSWLEHRVAWLYQRDYEYMALDSGFDTTHHFMRLPIPLYDAALGLLEAKGALRLRNTRYTADYMAVDHALGIILRTNEMQGRHGPYGRFLHRLSLSEPLKCGILPEVVVNSDDFEALQDEASLRMLSRNSTFDNIPPSAEKRALEICVRLTEWMYGQDESREYEWPRLEDEERHHRTQNLPIQWIAYILKRVGRNPEVAMGSTIDSECVSDTRYQIRLTLLKFFERVRYLDRDQFFALGATMDLNEYASRFLAAAAKILEPDEGQDFTICSDIVEILQQDGSTVYGYEAALIFCHAVFAEVRCMTPSLRRLVVALQKYDEEFKERLTLHLPSYFPKVRWGEFMQKARDLGMEEIEFHCK
ncbi:hypothetical protein NMY22_g19213 [Coprinellus aureogranulatus]|nr:hypothetical protein NMY22_g19213 [Coprinellus aureogranulatus]